MNDLLVKKESLEYYIRQSPREKGIVKMIIIRPATDERKVVEECSLSIEQGVVGDCWFQSKWRKWVDVQLSIMNVRVLESIEPDPRRWHLAGDNLLVNFDLSAEFLKPGDFLQIGETKVKIGAIPHRPCKKFSMRYGEEATQWLETPEGQALHLRGHYSRVVQEGVIKVGDEIRKIVS